MLPSISRQAETRSRIRGKTWESEKSAGSWSARNSAIEKGERNYIEGDRDCWKKYRQSEIEQLLTYKGINRDKLIAAQSKKGMGVERKPELLEEMSTLEIKVVRRK